MITALLSFLTPIFGIVDKVVDNQADATRIKAEIQKMFLDNKSEEVKAAMSVIVAEAQGESWLQRNWRPVLMLVCIIIVANNYILAPYIMLFTKTDVALNLDQNIWDLMKIGVGGYIASRGVEKTVKNWKAE